MTYKAFSYLIRTSAIVKPIPVPPPVIKATLPLKHNNIMQYINKSIDIYTCKKYFYKHLLDA